MIKLLLIVFFFPLVLLSQVTDNIPVYNSIQNYWAHKYHLLLSKERDQLRRSYIEKLSDFEDLSSEEQDKIKADLPKIFYKSKFADLATSDLMQTGDGRSKILDRLKAEEERAQKRNAQFDKEVDYLKDKVSDMKKFEEIIDEMMNENAVEIFDPKWLVRFKDLLPTDTCCACIHMGKDPSGKYTEYSLASCNEFIQSKNCQKSKTFEIPWGGTSSGTELIYFLKHQDSEWQKSCHSLEVAISSHGAWYSLFLENMAEVKSLCPRSSSFCAFQAGCSTFSYNRPTKDILEHWQKILESGNFDISQNERIRLIGNQCYSYAFTNLEHSSNSECVFTPNSTQKQFRFGSCDFGRQCVGLEQKARCLDNGTLVEAHCCKKGQDKIWSREPCGYQ